MAKRTRIIDIPVFTTQEKRFSINFCHDGGDGYRIFITPYANNTAIGDPGPYIDNSTTLQLTGSGSSPGMAHARLLKCSRPSKANTAAQRPIAIAKIAEMVKDMLVAYGLPVDKAALLAHVEQAAEVSA